MTLFEALLLGIVQGLTEFLPVSSSGHLALAQYLLGMEHLESYLPFDIVCHLGTLLAIVCIFFRQILKTLLRDHNRLLQLLLATALLFPLALASKPLAALFDRIDLLGVFFLITAALLLLGHYCYRPATAQQLTDRRWRDSLVIGGLQALAILPGVSRSGSTISGARLLGWPAEESVAFSFLLGIPAILGAATLETSKILFTAGYSGASVIPLGCYLIGFFASFATGLLALWGLIRIVCKEKLHYFAWYCILLGVVLLFITH